MEVTSTAVAFTQVHADARYIPYCDRIDMGCNSTSEGVKRSKELRLRTPLPPEPATHR